MEELRGIKRKSVEWLLEQYHASHVFRSLAESTQEAYETQHQVALVQPTKLGPLFGQLDYARLETHHFQKLVDNIADEGTPTKANSLLRYLKLVYSWGVRRGHLRVNPVKGVGQAKERQRRRLPDATVMASLIKLAASGGQLKPHSKGSCPPYLWAVADIAYLCRLRGIEVITLPESHGLQEGLRTNRRKGSRDNIVAWTPRLRMAWDWLIDRRNTVWKEKRQPVPLQAKNRFLVVSEDGGPLDKSSLDSAWQRLIHRAIKAKIITEDERFGLHDLKRKGITDTNGTRADKQDASGHKSAAMMDVYDLSVPVVQPSTKA
jgi:site-specific recombinase XerC